MPRVTGDLQGEADSRDELTERLHSSHFSQNGQEPRLGWPIDLLKLSTVCEPSMCLQFSRMTYLGLLWPSFLHT